MKRSRVLVLGQCRAGPGESVIPGRRAADVTLSGCSWLAQMGATRRSPIGCEADPGAGIGCRSCIRSFCSELKLHESVGRRCRGLTTLTTQDMELRTGTQMPMGQPGAERGPPCARCHGACTGFLPHSWRKSCGLCQCPWEDHALPTEVEEDHRIGQLLADTRYSGLTARVKGGEGARVYKRNRMIITNPITSRKDPTFLTVTYEWAPTGLNQKLAMRYMELIPKKLQPVAGTEGAQYRRLQLVKQLPAYDYNPQHCKGLRTEGEKAAMEAFVKQYKEDVMGVAEVALPCSTKQDQNSTAEEDGKKDYLCEICQSLLPPDAPAVYADRAGYKKQWHPACFMCCQCREPLVNLIYFWKDNRLWCGRHYCDSERPRCTGCDEMIFSEHFPQYDGKSWHAEHFSCVRCEKSLMDEPFFLDSLLLCGPCSSPGAAH
ncbi:LIM and cysteine-rich domains protein 1 isoform X2 [Engystomops pustulosus]|uniref:LIM and cysteine-rich domains protein 1 isoform X2 n=1 Tax=Engystomops pustulosus TaxID=76066 RepID=UPI003AFA5C19